MWDVQLAIEQVGKNKILKIEYYLKSRGTNRGPKKKKAFFGRRFFIIVNDSQLQSVNLIDFYFYYADEVYGIFRNPEDKRKLWALSVEYKVSYSLLL